METWGKVLRKKKRKTCSAVLKVTLFREEFVRGTVLKLRSAVSTEG